MTRHDQRIGRIGQDYAASALRALGVEMVEGIGTPVRLIPASVSRRDVYRVIWGDKVSGDHRGILPGGRSVLAETKTILDRNLRWSDLREHQPNRLQTHTDFGGLSLLIWVHSSGIYVLQWPVEGFGPGKSLRLEDARRLAIN